METVLFFATAGRGTEQFVAEEVAQVLGDRVKNVKMSDGKIFFQVVDFGTGHSESILRLKTVERIFVCIHREGRVLVKHGRPGHKIFSSKIQSISVNKWMEAARVWKQFQSHATTTETSASPDNVKSVESASKRMKLTEEEASEEDVTFTSFRVSCRISGETRYFFNVQGLSCTFGVAIKQHVGWRPELRKPTLEVFIQVNDTGFVVGLPTTKEPLSRRPYMRTFGLRTTVAYILARLGNIKPGDKVVDPMCGAGTILVEAAKSWPLAHYVGCDIDPEQLKAALTNVKSAKQSHNIDIMMSDVNCLPLPERSVDIVLCDLPFGNNHGSKEEMVKLYPDVIRTINRIIKPGGSIVLLTSRELKQFLVDTVSDVTSRVVGSQDQTAPDCDGHSSSGSTTQTWTEINSHYVKLGETHGQICHFQAKCTTEPPDAT